MTESDTKSLLTFPCDFTIKVFGEATDEFEASVLRIMHHYVPDLSDRAISSRKSGNGKYCALSITLRVSSKKELDDIYRELTSSPQVLMAL